MSAKCPALLLVALFFSCSVVGSGAGRCATPRVADGRARLRQSGQLVKFTCIAGYQLVGNRYASCRAGRWDVDVPVCVKPGCKPVVVANSIQVPLHGGAWVYFFCIPGHRHAGPSVIYCNGRSWNGTAPQCIVSAAPGQLSCDFEVGLCGWAQDELHDFDWKRWSGRTPSAFMFTGPSHDHTHGPTGTGSYVYLEATSRLENDTARLLSPVYYSDLAKNGCFSFFYHMFGKSIGGLRVYQKPASLELPALLALDGAEWQRHLLFERWGDQGDAWYGAVADLTDFHENFQIVIEGVRGASFTSDVAVDDVALLQGERCAAARALAPTPRPYDVESCAGRCERGEGEGGARAQRAGACGCGAACLVADDCCPDYFDLCGFAVTDATSECSPASELDVEGGRLPDKQPLVASTTDSGDKLPPPAATAAAPKSVPTTTTASSTTTTTTTPTPAITNVTRPTLPTAASTNSTKSVANFTSVRKSTAPLRTRTSPAGVAKTMTRPTVSVTTVAVLPAFRRTAAATATATFRSNGTSTTTTAGGAPARPAAAAPTMSAAARPTARGAASTRQRLLPKNLPHLNTQSEKDRVDGGSALSSGARATLVTLAVLSACAVAGWLVLWARTPRGAARLARLRGRAQHHPEVRFLTSNVDD